MSKRGYSVGAAIPRSQAFRRQRGLTLLELMVALVLGLLVSGGIVALFSATSQTNRVQAALSRVQENGRFAMGRMEADLRMAGAMFRQTAGTKNWMPRTESALLPRNAVLVNATGFVVRDMGTETGRLAGWTNAEVYPLSAAYFMRGYECGTGTCTPAVPTGANGFPVAGTALGNRVVGTDVLTLKYVRGIGWSYTVPANATGYGAVFAVDTTSGDGAYNFVTGDLVLVSDCSGSSPMVFRATVAGATITPAAGSLIQPGQLRPGTGDANCDARLFNFSRDFVSVSYWLQLAADANPDAVGRLIPTLMRSENGVAQEVAQGVERLDFLYGVAMMSNGGMAYLDATQVSASSNAVNCPQPSSDFERVFVAPYTWREPACLWRSLRSIEAHGLFNTVDEFGAMSGPDMAYWYSVDGGSGPVTPGATMPVTGRPTGRMIRREFVSLVSIRNGSN